MLRAVIHLLEELDIRKAIDVHTKGPATGRHGSGHGATAQGTVGSLLEFFQDNEDFRALPHCYVLQELSKASDDANSRLLAPGLTYP